ncbi:hypothetical protein WN48_07620 [Eufriesea mexicana]|uniref:Uncharacterized protein n=1 Tax=Eufriesea mexicana TaxID=516756 RepID=A0A310SMU0_9HYME|nr:hypothetical protein WN48_07620 [Eufriesea mexicana]
MKPIGFRRAVNPELRCGWERNGKKRGEWQGKRRKETIQGDEGGLKGEGEITSSTALHTPHDTYNETDNAHTDTHMYTYIHADVQTREHEKGINTEIKIYKKQAAAAASILHPCSRDATLEFSTAL